MASKQILRNLKFLKDQAYVNGKWISGVQSKVFPVISPWTKERIASVPDLSQDDVHSAIDAAHHAFQTWGSSSCKERSALLRQLATKMAEHETELATILTLESGKPITEAIGELKYAASFFEWFAEEAKRLDGDILPNVEPGVRRLVIRQPIGVAGMITPWNFPVAMITRKVGAALAAGCTVIVKPSEDTPLSALALAQLFDDLKVPSGVFNVVTCSREEAPIVGGIFCMNPRVRKLSFTGSTAVGKLLLEKCAKSVKRVSMELGGNAPFIVFASADLKLAAQSAVKARFRNAGQTCICAERILVQDVVYDEFLIEFAKAVTTLRFGDPLEKSTSIGPLINERGLNKTEAHVQDAVRKGARLVSGGKKVSPDGLCYEPTILADCSLDMICAQEETFGPVAPVFKFRTEEEALKIANSAESGLAGYFFSNDHRQIWRVAEKLEVGMVGVNENALSNEMIPFGGVKESGIGREGSRYGVDEYMQLKYICLGGL